MRDNVGVGQLVAVLDIPHAMWHYCFLLTTYIPNEL